MGLFFYTIYGHDKAKSRTSAFVAFLYRYYDYIWNSRGKRIRYLVLGIYCQIGKM